MKTRFLLIDDEPEIVNGLEIILTSQNPDYHVVGKAYDGLSGFDKAIEVHPDIIIADIRMPLCNGLDMIRDLREYHLNAEFILMSGYAEFEYAKKAMEYGVRHFLTKPIDEDELFAAIEKILEEFKRDEEFVECPDIISDELLSGLETAIDSMEDEMLKKAVNNIFNILRQHQSEVSIENMQMFCLSLVAYGTRKFPYAKLRMNHFLGKNAFTIQSVSKLGTIRQLENWVYNMLKGANEILLNDNLSCKQDVIAEAKEYILQNYRRSISLNEIADKFFINPYYFSQLFKKKTGMTYQKYLTDLRMKKAEQLLLTTDMKIYEISAEVGYTDTNYFSKLFERSIGQKPSAFRNR